MSGRIEFKFKDGILFDGKRIQRKFELKFSLLYMNRSYLTPLDSVINTIYEYDMKEAGFNVIREYKLLSEDIINKLSKMSKNERKVAIGKMQITNKELTKVLPIAIRECRKRFFMANMIQDHEVLSIKNDAIFVIGRKMKHTVFGDVEFIIKNTYNIYHKIEKLECYYNKREERLDIKGLNDDIVKEHLPGMGTFLMTVFDHLILGRYPNLKKYLRDFAKDYKSKNLPLIYYKEFNQMNTYRIKSDLDEMDQFVLVSPYVPGEILSDIDIVYNFRYFVMPLISRYIVL